MEASVLPKVLLKLADVFGNGHGCGSGGSDASEKKSITRSLLAGVKSRLEGCLHPGLSVSGRRGIEAPDGSNPGQSAMVAEPDEASVLARTPCLEGSGQSLQFLALLDQPIEAGLVQEDVVVNVPVVIDPLAVGIVEDQGEEKDVSSYRAVRGLFVPEIGSEMLTDDSGFHVTTGDVHLTASLSRLAPMTAGVLSAKTYHRCGQ
jgi:hypothetical protein